MSLTSLLKDSPELATRLARLCPAEALPEVRGLPCLASPLTKNYSLVGTGFDYLFRFEVQRRNPSAKAQPWVAEEGARLLKEPPKGSELFVLPDGSVVEVSGGRAIPRRTGSIVRFGLHSHGPRVAALARKTVSRAKEVHARFVRSAEPSKQDVAEVSEHALRLAKLDFIYRSGSVDPALDSVDRADVEDLVAMWERIPFASSMSKCLGPAVWLNPTFGRFSASVGGADADLVAGSCLIDIKTTIHPEFRKHLAQLVGYAMLWDAYRREQATSFPLTSQLGIYFARQAALTVVPTEPIFANRDYSEAFRALTSHTQSRSMSESRRSAEAHSRTGPEPTDPRDPTDSSKK